MAELRKSRKTPEGNIQINMQVPDIDSTNESSQFTNSSDNSDTEASERSQPLSPSNMSEDGNSSSKTAVSHTKY